MDSNDNISRKHIIDKIRGLGPSEARYPDFYIDLIREMPSAPSDIQYVEFRDSGEWVADHTGGFSPGGNPLYRCSKCGWVYGTHSVFPTYRYCPECGRYNYASIENAELEDTRDYWIFTFKEGHMYEQYYIKVYGTFTEACNKMRAKYGKDWIFQNSKNEWIQNLKNTEFPSRKRELEVLYAE